MELVEETADKLDEVHAYFKKISIGGNGVGLASGGLGIGAAATFWFPPVAIGLGVASAVTGAVAVGMSIGSPIHEKVINSDEMKKLKASEEAEEKLRQSIEEWLKKVDVDEVLQNILRGSTTTVSFASGAAQVVQVLINSARFSVATATKTAAGVSSGGAAAAQAAAGAAEGVAAAARVGTAAARVVKAIPIVGGVVSFTTQQQT